MKANISRLDEASDDAQSDLSSSDTSSSHSDSTDSFGLKEDAEAVAATLTRPPWEAPVINCTAWLENESTQKLRENVKRDNGIENATKLLDAADDVRVLTWYLTWVGECGEAAARIGDVQRESFYERLMESVKEDFIITTGILKEAARGMKFRWTSTDSLVTSIGRLVPEQWRHEEPLKFRDSRGNPRNPMDDFNANIDSICDSDLDSSLSNSYSEDRSSVSCLSDALSELAGDRDDNDGSSDGQAPSENTNTLNDLIDLQTPPPESPIPSFAFSPISLDHDLLETAFDQPLSQQSLLADLIDINPSPGAADNDSTADIADTLRSTGLGEITDLDTPPGH